MVRVLRQLCVSDIFNTDDSTCMPEFPILVIDLACIDSTCARMDVQCGAYGDAVSVKVVPWRLERPALFIINLELHKLVEDVAT